LEKVLDELMDGDIIIFQRDYERAPGAFAHSVPYKNLLASSSQPPAPLPITAPDFYSDLYYRVDVIFHDKAIPNDPGFTLPLSYRNMYDDMARAVGAHLNCDPYMIQFFKPQGGSYRDTPGYAIRCNTENSLKDMLMYSKPRGPKRLYYQKISIRIDELENKRQFKANYVSSDLKETKELVLYPDKNAFVRDLLAEAWKQIQPMLSSDHQGTKKLRLLEVLSYKISSVQDEMTPIDYLTPQAKTYRIEEIPGDQVSVEGDPDKLLIPCAHFHKDLYATFGTPFLLLIRQGESFTSVKERIRTKLDVPEKEFEKWRFCVICHGRVEYFHDENDYVINLSNFQPRPISAVTQTNAQHVRPWLGMDHVNKAPKRSRYNYLEKPIKIHN